MRQVFTSARIENVERVARLLREGGVEVRIANGRGWRGAIRGNFSYRESTARGAQPEIWVLRSGDYPRARQLLREAGLLQGGTAAGGAYLGGGMHGATLGERSASARRPGSRARTGALVVVALAVAGGVLLLRWSASKAPPRAPAAAVAQQRPEASALIADGTQVHAIAVPPALVAMLLRGDALPLPRGNACVGVDGNNLPTGGAVADARWQPLSTCAAGAPRIEIGPWRTDGSGSGTVAVAITAADGARSTRTLEVERQRDAWRVLGETRKP